MTIFKQLIVQNVIFKVKDIVGLQKRYLQFPKNYKKPIFNKNHQQELNEEKIIEIKHTPILPASNYETSSEFYDELTSKFINYIMRDGRKNLARNLMQKTYENVKRIQIAKYHKIPPEEKDDIELNPKVILMKAVENASPVMELQNIKRGGITYKVPVPLTAKKSKFIGMKWLLEAGKEKEKLVNLPTKLATELIDASNNEGRVITRKKDLYKQCQANRAYAHYRWM